MILKGLLGWSNKRAGLEFYAYDRTGIPRHNTEWGRLLVDQIEATYEGCPVIVLVLDRRTTTRQMEVIMTNLEGEI